MLLLFKAGYYLGLLILGLLFGLLATISLVFFTSFIIYTVYMGACTLVFTICEICHQIICMMEDTIYDTCRAARTIYKSIRSKMSDII